MRTAVLAHAKAPMPLRASHDHHSRLRHPTFGAAALHLHRRAPQPPRSAANPAVSQPASSSSTGNGDAAAAAAAAKQAIAAGAPANPAATMASVAASTSGAPTSTPTPSSSSAYGGGAATTAGPGAAPGENFSGDMLKPSVVNTPMVRAASVLAAVAAVAGSTALMPSAIGAFLHITSYAVLLGTQLWNTFFVGITMFKNVPRQTFGRVQAKLFPQYFALTAGANLLALGTLYLAGAAVTAPGTRALAALAVSLAGLLANWVYLEPICTRLMFERYDIENLPEKTEADKDRIATLYKQFGKWHGISSLVNLVSFCVTVSHGWYLATLLAV